MVCHTISAQVGAINLVADAIKSGELSWKAIAKSVRRLKHLKEKYVSQNRAPIPPPSLTSLKLWETSQEQLAARVYAKSTTVVRSVEGLFPLPPDSKQSPKKYVFLSPGKPAPVGGAVESGEEKTRVPWTPAGYIDLLRAQRKSAENIRFQEEVDLSQEEQTRLQEADVIVLATRNASLSQYQKQQGLELGKKWGDKLIVVATCDPYDFLDETDIIKNYIAIYEPTIPAFQSALNVMFGITQPSGSLPVGKPTAGIRSLGKQVDYFFDREKDLGTLHDMWNRIFPDWFTERTAIKNLVDAENARHYIHPSGFCLSFLINNVHGRVAVLGVLPEHRGKGIGTSLLTKASEGLRSEAAAHGGLKSFGLGSVFPRIWPGVPINIPQEYKDFFVHRGSFAFFSMISELKCHRLQESS
jgi:beta-N-acetylhexosaminidase